MSIRSENRRAEKIEEARKELSAQDKYRVRIEQRETERLAKNAEYGREIDRSVREETEQKNLSELGGLDETTRLKMNGDYQKLASFMDIGVLEFEEGLPKLKFIMQWAQDASRSSDIVRMLSFIKKEMNALGYREVGLTGLKKLYMYARLDADERRIQAEKKLLKR